MQGIADYRSIDEGERLPETNKRECGAVDASRTMAPDPQRGFSSFSPRQGPGKHRPDGGSPHLRRATAVFRYGSVDGQKFGAADPTVKARYSRKYFGKDRGVVAFSLLANHVALQTELLGANQHESYWVFDICYNNTSDIRPRSPATCTASTRRTSPSCIGSA